ncbi:hypothetical protein TRVL_09303 [Trypanosoma vivax]|nr:hypothetical protein TRVL_09303 [Trypanosoma vivax]
MPMLLSCQTVYGSDSTLVLHAKRHKTTTKRHTGLPIAAPCQQVRNGNSNMLVYVLRRQGSESRFKCRHRNGRLKKTLFCADLLDPQAQTGVYLMKRRTRKRQGNVQGALTPDSLCAKLLRTIDNAVHVRLSPTSTCSIRSTTLVIAFGSFASATAMTVASASLPASFSVPAATRPASLSAHLGC